MARPKPRHATPPLRTPRTPRTPHTHSPRAEAAQLLSEKDAFVEKKRAEAALEVARNEAQAKKVLAEAEGFAAAKLRAKRMYDLRIKQIEVLESLASNPNLVISGHTEGNLLAQLLASDRERRLLMSVDGAGAVAAASAGAGAGGARRR